ncbi:hypothetical protein HRbin36_01221 [bacterium HR36]|nr:hypothetical protein HRbin36_01221 [bacterium HR36]
MQDPRGQRVLWPIRRGEAEHIRIRNRFAAQPGAQHVPNHAPQPGIRSTIRFDRRRVVMRLHLEAYVIALVETHNPRIITEDTHAPITAPALPACHLRCGEDRIAQQIVITPLAIHTIVFNWTLERLVQAMFRPGLRDRFQLDIGRLPAESAIVLLDRRHLLQTQCQMPIPTEAQ